MDNPNVEQVYPTWRIEETPDHGWEVLRRADDGAVIGSAEEWNHYGAFPSRADALGFIEETIALEEGRRRPFQQRW